MSPGEIAGLDLELLGRGSLDLVLHHLGLAAVALAAVAVATLTSPHSAGRWSGPPAPGRGDPRSARRLGPLGLRPGRRSARSGANPGRSGRGRAFADPRGAAGATWARLRDLDPLLAGPGPPGRLVLGRLVRSGRRRPGAVLSAERGQSVAVIGPTQSGKTCGLAVPSILGWEGPVVAASVKTDLVRDTHRWRSGVGRVWVFDPVGVTDLPHSAWTPLRTSKTWAGARRTASALTEVASGSGTSADGEFWYATAAKMLGPVLFAAAAGGRTMADVIRWIDTQEEHEVAAILERLGVPEALEAANAGWLRDERQRSSVYTTAETVLEPFVEAADHLSGRRGPDVDPEALLDGSHTLYLCAPAHDQRRRRGLFTSVAGDVVEAAFTRSARLGRPLDPPLLVVLDEAANIAPLDELDGLASTCAGHGVQLVTIWQDLAQVTARYEARAPTVINNHRAKVFLSGIADPGTLDHVSQLVGEEEARSSSVTRDPTGARSVTSSPLPRRLLPGDALRRSPTGTGVLVYGALPPTRLALRPWWESRQLEARVGNGGRP